MFSPRQVALIGGVAPTLLFLGVVISDELAVRNATNGNYSLPFAAAPFILAVSLFLGAVAAAAIRAGLFISKCRGLSAGYTVLIPAISMPIVAVLTLSPVRTEAMVVSLAPELIDKSSTSALLLRHGTAAAVPLLAIGLVSYLVGWFSRGRDRVA